MQNLIDRYTTDNTGNPAVDWLVFGVGLLSLVLAVTLTVGTPNVDVLSDASQNLSSNSIDVRI